MRVAILYDGAADNGAAPDVTGVREAVDAVAESLGRLDNQAELLPLSQPLDSLAERLAPFDLAFNLAEGLGGQAEHEARIARLVERVGLPLTGAPSRTLALCRRKDRVNRLLTRRDVPVPEWAVVGADDARETGYVAWTAYPAIVKPAGEDGSVGIEEGSVVEDMGALALAVRRATGRRSMVQRFVPGRELNVGIVGDTVLPVAEIEFARAQRIVSYTAKWSPGSPADVGTRPVCPAALSQGMEQQAIERAWSAWSAVGGRGYGRVDLRSDVDGRLHVLDINPNPDLAPSAGLARMAAAAGWSYTELVRRIVAEAAA